MSFLLSISAEIGENRLVLLSCDSLPVIIDGTATHSGAVLNLSSLSFDPFFSVCFRRFMSMAKQSISLLLSFLLILCPLYAPAEEAAGPFHSIEEVDAFLSTCAEDRMSDFTIHCSGETYEVLRANNFAALSVLQAKHGIADAVLHYSDEMRALFFTNTQYDFLPWAECADENEVRQAISSFARDRTTAFRLLLSPELCRQFYESSRIHHYAMACGITECSPGYLLSSGIIHVQNIVYTELPYASASSREEFLRAVEHMAKNGTEDFYICLDPDFYNSTVENETALNQLLLSSPLEHYAYTKDPYRKSLGFSKASYSLDPRILCPTENAVMEAILRMGASGVSRFMLILDKAVFDHVSENNFEHLHRLEAEAGLVSCALSYNSKDALLLYDQAVIQPDAVRLESIQDIIHTMETHAGDGDGEINLFCTQEMYDFLMDETGSLSGSETTRMTPLHDLAAQAGLFDYVTSYSPITQIISFKKIQYYPGVRILRAVNTGNDTFLTARERETLLAARALAEACRSDAPLETARSIHDRLAEMIVYSSEHAVNEGDTAIGAFLNHQADCDGYADAFYLTASLAGLKVRCQHGDSFKAHQEKNESDSVTHMWNLLEIDGTWRLVDVTWDDVEQGDIRHTFFNLGYDRASRTHIWNEALTVPLAPETDLSVRPANEYTVSGILQPAQIIDLAAARQQTSFDIIYANPAEAENHEELLTLIRLKTPSAFSYSWDDRMLMLSVHDISF